MTDKLSIEPINTKSFPPILGENPKILILGTLPSKQSILLQQYYGNPQNIFWEIVFKLYNKSFSSYYNDKKALANENNIAIWDVCYSAYRQGSMDSAIQNVVPNSIDIFVKENPTIKKIIFNGQKAAKLYNKYFQKINNMNYLTLLSTSPANAKYNFKEKLLDWKQIL